MTIHVAEAVVPDNMQAPLKVPVLLVVNGTVPVGVMKVPTRELSVTVTVQEAAIPTVVDVLQIIPVVVVRLLTVIMLDVVGPLPL